MHKGKKPQNNYHNQYKENFTKDGMRGKPNSKLVCQIYDKCDHIACNYWHRINAQYLAPTHKAFLSPSHNQNGYQYMDTGASLHFTPKISSLSQPSEYQGVD